MTSAKGQGDFLCCLPDMLDKSQLSFLQADQFQGTKLSLSVTVWS